MSNHWDLLCRTCDERHEFNWNHGGDQIQQLIPLLPLLVAARPALEIVDEGSYDTSLPYGALTFAEKHHAHDLIAVDEYGNLHGGCARAYQCACCGHMQSCRKSRGHEGDCGPLPKGGVS